MGVRAGHSLTSAGAEDAQSVSFVRYLSGLRRAAGAALSAFRRRDLADQRPSPYRKGVRQNRLIRLRPRVGLNGTRHPATTSPLHQASLQGERNDGGISAAPIHRQRPYRNSPATCPPSATPGHPQDGVSGVALRDSKTFMGFNPARNPPSGADGNVYAVAAGSVPDSAVQAKAKPAKIPAACRQSARNRQRRHHLEREIEFRAQSPCPMCASRAHAPIFNPAKRIAPACQHDFARHDRRSDLPLDGAAFDPAEFKGNVVAS